jgi:hypothetical protein
LGDASIVTGLDQHDIAGSVLQIRTRAPVAGILMISGQLRTVVVVADSVLPRPWSHQVSSPLAVRL